MKVLIIDPDGCGTDMAYRAAEAGHEVKFWQPKDNGRKSLDGVGFPGIIKPGDWRQEMAWAKSGLVINLFNEPKITKELDRFRDLGFSVFGPSFKSAQLEIKRELGMKSLERAGVRVPGYQTFDSLQAAIDFIKKEDRRFVFKTLGDEEDKSMSYVGHSPDDMIYRIQSWIDKGVQLKGPCMLQDFIEGIEVGIAGWMTPSGFLDKKFNVNFEYKKLMPDNYGPATGEMGTVTKYVPGGKLHEDVLQPLEMNLRDLGHIGDLDINCIVDDKGQAWALEYTCRFGWPSTQIVMHAHKGDPVKWMKDAISGKDTLQIDDRVTIGALMTAPPFPQPDENGDAIGMLVSGIEDEWERVSPWQVMLKKEQYITTGPYVCVAVAQGSDVHDVIPQVFETTKRIKFPNKMVRTDIGKDLEKNLPKLKSLGYEELPDW